MTSHADFDRLLFIRISPSFIIPFGDKNINPLVWYGERYKKPYNHKINPTIDMGINHMRSGLYPENVTVEQIVSHQSRQLS